MKKQFYFTIAFALLASSVFAQFNYLTVEPDGGNKRASVSEQIGIVNIEIRYNRPGVKGREGNIYNTPVAHYGFKDQGHGTSYSAPWRAGANENTTISFSHPVRIEGKDLPAGTYGFFIALDEEESTIIFNKFSKSWGSFYYEPADDVLRVTVKNQKLDKSVEWLKYEFIDQTPTSAVIAMSWEYRMIPFKVEAETVKLQIESFKNDFRLTRSSNDFVQAANYCLRHNVELEQALAWMDRAIYFRVMGEKNFRTLSTKAAILTRLGRNDEAKELMKEAIPMGTVTDVHFYGRQLMISNEMDEAFKVFKGNYDKYPNVFTTNVGMGRIWSAKGDYKKALTYMRAALAQAPDEYNKNSVVTMIKKLEEGKDANK